ncbi:MAG: hypothetical protein ACRDY6_10610 [Acidimicrobiia bacterium]
MRLADLGLPGRVVGILEREGINDDTALVRLNERELLSLPGIGRGALDAVRTALDRAGLSLTPDPYGSYVCARHGDSSWDTNLANLFLCDECAVKWQEEAFDGTEPAYIGAALAGYCLNCNVMRDDVRLRQWFLCGTCERVARSIGRSVVAERFVAEQWGQFVGPQAPGLRLVNTDVPTLRRRERNATETKRAEIDFVAHDEERDEDSFGFELKTGKSYISGVAQVGARMGQFQLDTSDCDDITAVMEREDIPVYLVHVQVIDRAYPPTLQYVALGAWWTDVFRMHEHFQHVQRRPRETRDAAYFNTAMFEDFGTLNEHIRAGAHEALAERLRTEGIPALYERAT